jgi:hypothetical protein
MAQLCAVVMGSFDNCCQSLTTLLGWDDVIAGGVIAKGLPLR